MEVRRTVRIRGVRPGEGSAVNLFTGGKGPCKGVVKEYTWDVRNQDGPKFRGAPRGQVHDRVGPRPPGGTSTTSRRRTSEGGSGSPPGSS